MCIEQRPTAKKLNDYNSMVQNAFKTVTKLENAIDSDKARKCKNCFRDAIGSSTLTSYAICSSTLQNS